MSHRKNIVRTQKRVRISCGKRSISVRTTEVRLYVVLSLSTKLSNKQSIIKKKQKKKKQKKKQKKKKTQSENQLKLLKRSIDALSEEDTL